MLDKSRIGLICTSPRATRERQDTAIREAGAQWIVEIGRDVKSWREAVGAIHNGDTVYVFALCMVPTKRGGDELSPTAQVADFLIEVHERGGTVEEVYTGRKSADRKQRRAMIADAHKALRRGTRALPSKGRGPGRPKNFWPPDVLAKARDVWFSKDYATNTIAAKYLPKTMNAKQAWEQFGPSGRPFKRKKR